MKVVLPAVEQENRHSSGNHYFHSLSPPIELDGTVDTSVRDYIVVRSAQTSCCFTDNELHVDTTCQFIVLCKRAVKQDHLLQLERYFVRWLKHPALRNYSPREVVDTWQEQFHFIEEDPQNNVLGLRIPQIGAIHAILGHLKLNEEIGTVVLPTGTGKTETMLSVLIANRCTKLLVIVPSHALRYQIADKFRSLGYLRKFGIVGPAALNPITGIVEKTFDSSTSLEDFLTRCNVIVATVAILDSNIDHLAKLTSLCSHLFVDEAHHSKAAGWERLINKFSKGRVVLFTATPYRNDGQRLEGRIIFNFSLRKAQEQGYFKTIEFLPIREYDATKADERIAQKAIQRLREDLSKGHDHILMARCNDKERARTVFSLYESETDLNPVIVFSGIPSKDKIIKAIRERKHRIVVCVDMMGEGFDLPQLKVAAFHDIRKSLPITLQFAGRFTRTSLDATLGNASFVANVYQPDVKDELEDLYAKDANWNLLLPGISARTTQDQIDFQQFISGFQNMTQSIIPFQNIRPALSTVVYRNRSDGWNPRNFEAGISGLDSYTHKFSSYNANERTMVILLGRQSPIEWVNFVQLQDIEWSLIILFWNSRQNLLYIHGSDKSGHFQEMAKAVLGDGNAILINEMDVFKAFHNIQRLSLYNVGLRKVISKDLSFQSYIGRSVGEALSFLDRRQGMKNNIFGVGFSDGEKVSLGCSKKGRIWSYARGNIKELTTWFTTVGSKLIDVDIDPDKVLEGTLRPDNVARRPDQMPYFVDWDHSVYDVGEGGIEFRTINATYTPANAELFLTNATTDGPLQFEFRTDDVNVLFQLNLRERMQGVEPIADFDVTNLSSTSINVVQGKSQLSIEEFFKENPPVFWFVDGSFLHGNSHVRVGHQSLAYPKEDIVARSWSGIDISKESQGINPIVTSSIQHAIIQELSTQDYDIVYDDDSSGEVADVICIKDNDTTIDIHLFHLKWATGGIVGNDISNLYEVCGQAQKSVAWRYKEPEVFFDHLFRRITKRKGAHSISRVQKGDEETLERLRRLAKNEKPFKWHITIVQPAISKLNVTNNILLLLGVTSKYIKDVAAVDLKVIGSA
ncbi:DEAD/DEAH box helicase family protein [Chryseolinea sp. T2]|uniref:DEAD/DEAH box helicase n=1 Tax=Chryseolinea sp. T2 TaxID=3129255 RepID=UPI003076B9FE